MLSRALDDSYPPEVRANVTWLTTSRVAANTVYRYIVPFLAVVAKGLHAQVGHIGLALTISELGGLSASRIGRLADRGSHRAMMVAGLTGLAVGSGIIALSRGLAVFGVGLVVLALSKLVFDISLTGWVATHVPAPSRGRVIGIVESGWAGGLFIGVTLLGTVTAIWSWRWAYALGVVLLAATAVTSWIRLPADQPRVARRVESTPGRRTTAPTWWFVIAMGMMLFAISAIFVLLGPWLSDEHHVGATGLTVVAFGLGIFELVSSTSAARLTDRWGGWVSVTRGGSLIVPAAVALALGHRWLAIGLGAFVLLTLGFEYAIVSSMSVATSLVPGAPGAGVGLMITTNTIGRASGIALATWLYDHHGLAVATWPAAVAAGAAIVALGTGARRRRA